MSKTELVRQILLDLLAEYREFETPGNPELLKLHIDAATDRLDTIYEVTTTASSDSETTLEVEKNVNGDGDERSSDD